MTHSLLAPAALLVLVPSAVAASPQVSHTVIHTVIPSSPTSLIPGAGGARFSEFQDVHVSPNGAHWALRADSTASSSFDAHFLADGNLVFQETFTTLPWNAGVAWRGGLGRINDSGQLILAGEGSGGTHFLARGENAGAGPWALLLEDGDAVAGAAGITWTQFFGATIGTDGRVGVAGTVSSGRRAATFDGALLALTQTTTPTGSSSGAPISQIDGGDLGFDISADGSTWGIKGSVGSQNAIVVNNHVTLEVGEPVPGSGFTRDISRVTGQSIDPAGRAFGWGLNEADGRDWIIRDGVIIAEEFDPIVPGSPDVWGQTLTLAPGFGYAVGNRAGDYLIAGGLRGQSIDALVRNGTEEIIRTGDPIDVDGNGLFDDDAHLGFFRELGGWGDNGALYAIVTLRNSSNANLGQAVIRFDIPGGSLGQVYCQSQTNSTGSVARLSLTGSDVASVNNLELHCDSLPLGSSGYFLVGQTQASVPGAGGSQGTICLGGSIGRFVGGGVKNSGTTGSVSGPVDVTVIPTPLGPVPAIAGQTWNFQYWYRDANPATTSNFSPGVALTFQ